MQSQKLNKSFPVNILGNFLSPVEVARNLGVWFYSDFSFLRHHSGLIAVNALVGSLICHSLFKSLSVLDLCKLPYVSNSIGRVNTNTIQYSHIHPIRQTFHWIPVEYRSVFRTALLVYKFLHKRLRSHSFLLQYVSLLNILASA